MRWIAALFVVVTGCGQRSDYHACCECAVSAGCASQVEQACETTRQGQVGPGCEQTSQAFLEACTDQFLVVKPNAVGGDPFQVRGQCWREECGAPCVTWLGEDLD